MRVLVVDDNEQNRYMLQVLLEGHGYQAASAGEGAEALEIARRDPPDMIISDILMPVMDGFALCREWKKDEGLKAIPFVFYTATYTDSKDEEFALSLGAERFIIKPQEPDVFMEMVREVFENYEMGRLVALCEPVEEEAVIFKEYNDALIRKLEDKLVQLEEANRALEREIAERKWMGAELKMHREHLEELVDARTADLQRANDRLAREISERVRAEVALQKATDRAKRSAKVAEQARVAAEAANRAKSAFLANMSHELRTPLNAILGFTQLMRRDPALAPAQRKNLRIIYQSGEHLLELLNDVLEMSKIEAGCVTFTESDFDLYQLLATLESMFAVHAEKKGLRLGFERAPDVPQYIRTDERKLRQVLINLLGNAVKFTHAGSVTLRVWTKDKGPRTEESPPSVVRRSSLVFEVEDTGVGIAPEEMDQLFEAFTQTASGQEALEGSGLGLVLSRRFVQLMGGDITVESPPLTPPPMGEPALSLTSASPVEPSKGAGGGPGSLFRFDIRATVVQASAVQARQPTRRVVGLAPGQGVCRILVAEDSEASRALLVQLLTAVGFEVREAANGQEAIATWESWNPHLIWMDMRMPVLDGYQATQHIKSQIANTQQSISNTQSPIPIIIALTAHAFEEERTAILAAGCDGFVRKPFQEEEIFEKMAQHLNLSYVHEELAQPAELTDELAPVALTPADLAALPADWVADLRQAARSGEAERILELVGQIEPEHTSLAKALTQLVHEFRFDKLVALITERQV